MSSTYCHTSLSDVETLAVLSDVKLLLPFILYAKVDVTSLGCKLVKIRKKTKLTKFGFFIKYLILPEPESVQYNVNCTVSRKSGVRYVMVFVWA